MGGVNGTSNNQSTPVNNQKTGYNDDYYDWSKGVGKYENQSNPLRPNLFNYEQSKVPQITATQPMDPSSAYSYPVQADRERVVKKGFDPESAQYDYLTAEGVGMKPNNYNQHMGSVAPVNEQMSKQYGLPEGEAYIVLKGSNHPTHNFLVDYEDKRGFQVKKYGDRYFSVPKIK